MDYEDLKHEPYGSHMEYSQQQDINSAGDEKVPGESSCDWTPEEEKQVVRKVDLRMYPMLCIVFGFSLLDRTNISLAYIAGMAKDLGLAVGARYNIALLLFFVPYFIFEIPSNWVIRRVGARFWMSFLITAWGICLLGMGFIHNWQGLAGLRTGLGLFEAGLLPGALFIISCWYRQYEMSSRVTGFWMTSQLFSAFGPILAYAVSLIRVGDGMYRAGWRWIFIIEGILTVLAGLIAPFFLLEFPEKARFLNDRERHIALNRVWLEKESKEIKHPTVREALEMLVDWKILCCCILYFIAASSVYSLAYFAPIILREGLGYSYTKSVLLSTPPVVCSIILSIIMARVSDLIRMRWPILIFQASLAIAGLLIILYTHPPGVRYFGLFVASYGIQSNVPGILSYAQNQTGRLEKKGISSAAVVSAGALGGICGSTIFKSQDAPLYLSGMWATIGMQFLFIILTFSMSMYFKRQNTLADRGVKPALEKVEGFRYAP